MAGDRHPAGLNLHGPYDSKARCAGCGLVSEPRPTGTAPPGWLKIIGDQYAVTYRCATCWHISHDH